MTSQELCVFLQQRNWELSQEDLLMAIDISRNPQINHIKLNGDRWEMWDEEGNYFCFSKRD